MMKLFVADDSATIRERIVKMLLDVPNAVVVGEASDGFETMRGIIVSNPDLVILDLQIPKGTGIEILPQIKNLSLPPLVMVLTNYATSRHREACARLGADYFFDKSREFEKAIEVIETLANSYAPPATDNEKPVGY
jgi:two-component system response regulator DevR